MGLVIEGTIALAGGEEDRERARGRDRGCGTASTATRRMEAACSLGGPSSPSHKWGLILLMEDK